MINPALVKYEEMWYWEKYRCSDCVDTYCLLKHN